MVISYLVEEQGKDALLNEKKNKLLSITHLLDQSLGDDFSRFSHLLRKDRITALNNTLTERTEVITRDFPRVGAGFYNKELDAIITYAPKNYMEIKLEYRLMKVIQGELRWKPVLPR